MPCVYRENDGKIEAELIHVLRRLEKTNDDQYSRKKVCNTSAVNVHCESKKESPLFLGITLGNVDRFLRASF